MGDVIPFTPAFPHPGGKTRMLKHILPHIPQHKVYVEPFCGGCAVLLGKERSRLEVVNDADGDMVTFYRYAVHHPEALFAEFRKWPGNSRANFEALLRNPGFTDLQRAARWFLLKVDSFGAQSATWGRARADYHGYDPARHERLISQLRTRLDRVMIECGSWRKVVEFYDRPDTFAFLDPPYVECGKTAYDPFTPEDMRQVREWCDQAKGTWLLTVDDSPACREIFAGLPVRPMAIRYSLGNHTARPKQSGELLIMHPRLAAAGDCIEFSRPVKRRCKGA